MKFDSTLCYVLRGMNTSLIRVAVVEICRLNLFFTFHLCGFCAHMSIM